MDLREILSRAESHPESTVSFYDGEDLRSRTHRRFVEDVRDAVERLKGIGAGPGMRIGIQASNCYEWVVYDLALLALRCCSVAFPPELAQEPLERLAERFGLSLLLVREADGWIPPEAASWVASLEERSAAQARVRAGGASGADPDFIEIGLIFSSGSTGRLKCMVVNRPGVEQMIEHFVGGLGSREDDSILVFLPLSNYQQRVMTYAALHYGWDLHLADPAHLFCALRELRPSWLVAPPAFYESIEARLRARGPWTRFLLSSLSRIADGIPHRGARAEAKRLVYRPVYEALGARSRVLLTGMAPIKRSTLELFEQMNLPLYETYGLTECGPIACNFPGARRLGSVGRALGEGEVRLAEDGEVIVKRERPLTRGYFEADPEEAASTYVTPNTIATGDIGRFDEDGYLYVVGRKKEIIVTSSGYKVHPEAIEAQLSASPLVSRAVVFGGAEFPALAALICLPEHAPARDEAAVRDAVTALNDRLPGPSRIGRIAFTRTPFTAENKLLTRNLKVDRQEILRRFRAELGAMDAQREEAERTAGAAPENETEEELVRIWSEVLGVRKVGVTDDFFEMGGESILALQVVQRAREAGIEITPSQLVSHPTIREIAAEAGQVLPIRAEQGVVRGDAPLGPAQRYLVENAGSASASFGTSLLLEAGEPVIAALLERAVAQLLRHHDALRLRVRDRDGARYQSFGEPSADAPPVFRRDWSDVAEEDEERLIDRVVHEAQADLDPCEGRCFRVDLLDRGRRRPSRILVTASFLVVDGVSWPILVEDLARAYRQIADGGAIQLPAKTTSYKDWALHQLELADSRPVLEQCSFWTGLPWERLKPLPTEGQALAGGWEQSASIPVEFSEDETDALVRAARERQLPLAEVVLAASLWALGQWTKTDTLGVTLRSHGRARDADVEVSRTVGSFVSLFPTLFDLGATDAWANTAAAVHEQLAGIPEEGRSFGLLRYLSTDPLASNVGRLPVPEVGFNYRGRFPSRYESFELAPGRAIWERVPHPHVIDISGSLIASRLAVHWEYRADLLTSDTAEQLTTLFRRAVRSATQLDAT